MIKWYPGEKKLSEFCHVYNSLHCVDFLFFSLVNVDITLYANEAMTFSM